MFLKEKFGVDVVKMHYVCDVCGKSGLAKENIESRHCGVCNFYYDLCKDDISYAECPFCNKHRHD
jgi:hypothetical protein